MAQARTRLAAAVAICLGLAMLGGCLAAPRRAQSAANERKRTFALEAAAPAQLAAKPLFAAIRRRPFSADPPFGSRSFIVRRAGGETLEDFYSLWLAPPQDLIGSETARYLEKAGLFAAVYGPGAATRTRLGLDGVVTRLELDCTGGAPAAAVGLRLTVIDERAPDFDALFTVEKECRAPLAGSGPDAICGAFSSALSQALAELAAALESAPLPR